MSRTRPSQPHAFRRHHNLGALQTLLLTACPPGEDQRASIPVLARHLGISNKYIYKWIANDKVPPNFVTKIVELSDGRVTFEQFHKYVFV